MIDYSKINSLPAALRNKAIYDGKPTTKKQIIDDVILNKKLIDVKQLKDISNQPYVIYDPSGHRFIFKSKAEKKYIDYLLTKINEGATVELEHKATIQKIETQLPGTTKAAQFIAADHINENHEYYQKLEKAHLKEGGNIQKLDEGTVLNGPSHENGGIDIVVNNKPVAEAQGGEIVINAENSKEYCHELSEINQRNGNGKPLDCGCAGKQTDKMAKGGLIYSDNDEFVYSLIKQVFAGNIQSIKEDLELEKTYIGKRVFVVVPKHDLEIDKLDFLGDKITPKDFAVNYKGTLVTVNSDQVQIFPATSKNEIIVVVDKNANFTNFKIGSKVDPSLLDYNKMQEGGIINDFRPSHAQSNKITIKNNTAYFAGMPFDTLAAKSDDSYFGSKYLYSVISKKNNFKLGEIALDEDSIKSIKNQVKNIVIKKSMKKGGKIYNEELNIGNIDDSETPIMKEGGNIEGKPLFTGADASRQVKKELKEKFPAIKFSVRYSSYSGGNSINVSWNFGPTTAQVDAIIDKYQYGRFDGMTDSYSINDDNQKFVDEKGQVRDIGGVKYVSSSRTTNLNNGQTGNEQWESETSIQMLIAKDLVAKQGGEWKGQYTPMYDNSNETAKDIAYRILRKNAFDTDDVKTYDGLVDTGVRSGQTEEFYKIKYNSDKVSVNKEAEKKLAYNEEWERTRPEREAKAKADQEAYEKREADRKKAISELNIKQYEMLDDADYFIKSVQWPSLNKNGTLDEYKAELEKDIAEKKDIIQKAKISQVIIANDKDFNVLASNLMTSLPEVWKNIGGNDIPLAVMIQFGIDEKQWESYSVPKDKLKMIMPFVYRYATLVYNSETKESFLVDTQGYDYARYVGFTNDKDAIENILLNIKIENTIDHNAIQSEFTAVLMTLGFNSQGDKKLPTGNTIGAGYNTQEQKYVVIYDTNQAGEAPRQWFDNKEDALKYINQLIKENNVEKQKEQSISAPMSLNKPTSWEQLPQSWKIVKKLPAIAIDNTPYDKNLQRLIESFLSSDILRPVMQGAFFDEKGITATDAHKLIHLPYPNKEFSGVYRMSSKIKIDSASLKGDKIDGKYPNYEAVIPGSYQTFRISVLKLKTFISAIFSGKLTNNITHQVVLAGPKNDEGQSIPYGYNGEFLTTILNACLLLGKEYVYFGISAPNKALIVAFTEQAAANAKDYIGKETIFLLMPVHVYYEDATANQMPIAAVDLDWEKEFRVAYDLVTDNIYNFDGTVANFDFNLTKATETDLTAQQNKLVSAFKPKNTSIPIIEGVLVKDGKLFATDLDTTVIINGVNKPNNVYYYINDALVEYNTKVNESDNFVDVEFKEKEFARIGTINRLELLFNIEKCNLCVSTDTLRPAMTGVHFTKDVDSNSLIVEATNAHIAFRNEIKNNTLTGINVIVPATKKLKVFLENVFDQDIEILVSGKHIIFKAAEAMVYSNLIQERYPDLVRVIPSEADKALTMDIKNLKECIKSITKEEKKQEVTLAFKPIENGIVSIDLIEYPNQAPSKVLRHLCKVDASIVEKNKQISKKVFLGMPAMIGASRNPELANNYYFGLQTDILEAFIKITESNKLVIDFTSQNRAILLSESEFKQIAEPVNIPKPQPKAPKPKDELQVIAEQQQQAEKEDKAKAESDKQQAERTRKVKVAKAKAEAQKQRIRILALDKMAEGGRVKKNLSEIKELIQIEIEKNKNPEYWETQEAHDSQFNILDKLKEDYGYDYELDEESTEYCLKADPIEVLEYMRDVTIPKIKKQQK